MMTNLKELTYTEAPSKERGIFHNWAIMYKGSLFRRKKPAAPAAGTIGPKIRLTGGSDRLLAKLMDADLAATDKTVAIMRRTLCIADLAM